MRRWLSAAFVVAGAMEARAQVGFLPERSPYRDMQYQREWTAFSGYFDPQPDPVGVAPQGGAMFGGRFDARIGGPAYGSFRLANAFVPRNIIDPTKPIAERFVGTETVPLLFTDLSFGINLTGYRTWRGMAPFINAGVGLTADLRGKNDVGDYRFGVPFTATFGAGFKWILRDQWQFRFDWSNFFYKIRYPESYFLRTGEDDPVRLPNDAASMWRRNVGLLLGVSYLYHR